MFQFLLFSIDLSFIDSPTEGMEADALADKTLHYWTGRRVWFLALSVFSLGVNAVLLVQLVDGANSIGQTQAAANATASSEVIASSANLQGQHAVVRPEGEPFDEAVTQSKWYLSKEQQNMLYIVALQKSLNEAISSMRGVNEAKVVITVPQSRGVGRPASSGSAVVWIKMENDHSLNSDLARSIGFMVSGAKSNLEPEAVVVVDTASGQHYRSDDRVDG